MLPDSKVPEAWMIPDRQNHIRVRLSAPSLHQAEPLLFLVSTPVRGHARVEWGGGVGWDVNVHCDCNHIVRSLALPHVRHATLLHVLLHFHTYVMLRCCTFSCTSTHTSCYAAARSLALPHVRHATLLHVLLRFHTYVMLRCCTFSCTSTHTSCYAAARFLALPHVRHATLLHVLVHFHTYIMLRARRARYADACKAWTGAFKQQVPQMAKRCPQLR